MRTREPWMVTGQKVTTEKGRQGKIAAVSMVNVVGVMHVHEITVKFPNPPEWGYYSPGKLQPCEQPVNS